VDPSVVNKAVKVAVRRAGLTKVVSAHTFTRLLQFGRCLKINPAGMLGISCT
jgi:hypothetical protein